MRYKPLSAKRKAITFEQFIASSLDDFQKTSEMLDSAIHIRDNINNYGFTKQCRHLVGGTLESWGITATTRTKALEGLGSKIASAIKKLWDRLITFIKRLLGSKSMRTLEEIIQNPKLIEKVDKDSYVGHDGKKYTFATTIIDGGVIWPYPMYTIIAKLANEYNTHLENTFREMEAYLNDLKREKYSATMSFDKLVGINNRIEAGATVNAAQDPTFQQYGYTFQKFAGDFKNAAAFVQSFHDKCAKWDASYQKLEELYNKIVEMSKDDDSLQAKMKTITHNMHELTKHTKMHAWAARFMMVLCAQVGVVAEKIINQK